QKNLRGCLGGSFPNGPRCTGIIDSERGTGVEGRTSQVCVGQVVHADPGKAALDMSLRRYATRLSAASLSPFGEFLLRFVRTMILSHLLSPGDLGAAVVLTSILTGCEVITDIGLDKFVMV